MRWVIYIKSVGFRHVISYRRWVIQLYEVQYIIVRTASNRKCFGGLYSDDDDDDDEDDDEEDDEDDDR